MKSLKIQKLLLIVSCFVIGFSIQIKAQSESEYKDLKKASENPLKVIKLDLNNQNLTEFPKEIANFKNLEALDLSLNKIKNIPASIQNLKKLKVLQMYSNELTSLPNEIGELDSLETLNMYDNQIKNIPVTIGKLSQLSSLYLQSNQITNLPNEIGNLTELQSADFSYNKLSNLPNSFFGLNKLIAVNFYQNKFIDMNEAVLKMPSLSTLYLDKNLIENPDFLLKLTYKNYNDVPFLIKNLVKQGNEKLNKIAEKVSLDKIKALENQKTKADTLTQWYNILTFIYKETNQLEKAKESALKSIEIAKDALKKEKNVEIIRNIERNQTEAQSFLVDIEKDLNRLFLRQLSFGLGLSVVLIALGFVVYFYFSRKQIASQKAKADKLLLNILPKDVADELKEKGITEVKTFQNASILFADVKGFSKIAGKVTPQKLIEELDTTFGKFDDIIAKHNLERIKTIGDCYMCVGGVPVPDKKNPVLMTLAALEIQHWMAEEYKKRQAKNEDFWEVRLGIHTGELVAGVIGKLRFAYDVWGHAVNTASRMESGGEVGKVNITGMMHELIKDFFECTFRGQIEAKNIGWVDTYFVDRIKPDLSKDEDGFEPNDTFFALLEQKTKG